jgi:hypothetical protein
MTEYPRIAALGLTICKDPPMIFRGELHSKLTPEQSKQFSELFGVQTCPIDTDGNVGLYPWDAEAVLERMASGRLIGSQLIWD